MRKNLIAATKKKHAIVTKRSYSNKGTYGTRRGHMAREDPTIIIVEEKHVAATKVKLVIVVESLVDECGEEREREVYSLSLIIIGLFNSLIINFLIIKNYVQF